MDICSKDLRFTSPVKDIPNNPGWYTWFAKESEFRNLLDSPHLLGRYADDLLSFKGKELKKITKDKVTYYGIYFGIATESLRQRIAVEHVNWSVTKSTLRKSISALIYGGKADEYDISKFMDSLIVCYTEYSGTLATKSDRKEASNCISKSEKDMISKFLFPLNIKDNSDNIGICKRLGQFIKELKLLRENVK